LLSAAGNEDVSKAMKQNNPAEYKNYVDEVRRAGLSDAVMHYMAWKEGNTGYYIPSKDADKFKKVYDEQYDEQLKIVQQLNPDMSAEKQKRKAANTAAMFAQYSVQPITISIPEK
jgi:hypothetical protein